MVIWRDVPHAALVKNTLTIVRTPAPGVMSLHLTSEKAFGCPIHHWGGRSWPCTQQEGCEPCQKGNGYRWKAYIGAIEAKSADHVIWECTAPIHLRLAHAVSVLGSIRGLKIRVKRRGDVPNGRILMDCGNRLIDVHDLPTEPNVREIMEHVWANRLVADTSTNGRENGQEGA